MIRVRNLQKSYEGVPALTDVSFSLPSGALAAVVGGSGAGKSTLLRCLVGLEPFDAGEICVDEIEIVSSTTRSRTAAARALRGRVGLVFQSFELFPHLTVLENCALAPMMVQGRTRAEAEERGAAVLTQLGLGTKQAQYPDRLSGGQRQRVAIARALAMEPRVLLYDEPTSALDPTLRREVHGLLRRVQETGVTQIVVTHDVPMAREATDQVLVLDHGHIVEQGPSAEVLSQPATEAARRLL